MFDKHMISFFVCIILCTGMLLLSYKCTLLLHCSILRLQIWKKWQGELIQCHTMKLGNSCAKASKFCYWVTTGVFVPSFSVKAFAKMNLWLRGRCWLYCFSEICVVSYKSRVQCLCALFCVFDVITSFSAGHQVRVGRVRTGSAQALDDSCSVP